MKKIGILLLALVVSSFATAQVTDSLIASSGFPNSGDKGKLYYTILSSNATTLAQIDKPLIMIETFDPRNDFDYTTIAGLFSLNSVNQLGPTLLSEGYDIIIVDFAVGNTHMKRNAFALESLIRLVNNSKASSAAETKIIGLGYGGVIARYALSHMEQQGEDHSCSLFMSIDSPHEGANFPHEVQSLIIDAQTLFGNPIFPTMIFNNTFFECEASKEMLLEHGSRRGAHTADGLRNIFMNSLESLNAHNGYPQDTRNVALSNGSMAGDTQTFAGDKIGQADILFRSSLLVNNSTLLSELFEARSLPLIDLPDNGKHIISLRSDILSTQFGTSQENDFLVNNVPGSTEPLIMLAWAQLVNSLGFDFSQNSNAIWNTNTAFIPTASALGIKRDNLFINMDEDPDLVCQTAFDGFYAGRVNGTHTGFDAPKANWIYDQITAIDNNNTLTLDNETFNFGQRNHNQLSNNLIVKNGGKLCINTSNSSDYTKRNQFFGNTRFNPSNTDIQVYTTGCNSDIDITIEDGELALGDGNTRKGTFNVLEGDNLILRGTNAQPAILTIKNGSKLIIKPGGKLTIGSNSQIILDGPDAILEFQGDLVIEDNAELRPTGGSNGVGIVRFNTSGVYNGATAIAKINVGVNSSMTFEAANGTTKVLEIAGESLWIDDKNSTNFVFTLKNATAEISHEGMLNLGCRAVFDGATVQKMGSAGHYKGVYLWAKPNNVVKNSTFQHASSGLQFSSTKWGIRLNVENSNFVNNYNGLTVLGGGLTIENSNASDNNGYGILAKGLKLPGYIDYSNMNNNQQRGLRYESNSGAPLTMVKNILQNNPNAMKFISTGDLGMKCNQFIGLGNFGSQTGIEFMSGSLLMTSSRGGLNPFGFNNFKDNEKSVWFKSDWNQYAKIELNEGMNALSNKVNTSDPSTALFGLIDSRNQSNLTANFNKWDNRTSATSCTPSSRGCPESNFGGSPNFENYSLNAPFGFPTPMMIGWVTLNDASPQSHNDIASEWPSVCDGIMLRRQRIFSGEGDIYPNEGTPIVFTNGGPPKTIGTAVEDIFNWSKDTLVTYSEITEQWKDILTYDGYPLPLSPIDEYYLDIASTQILSVAGHYLSEMEVVSPGVINDAVIQDAVQSCDFWINTLQSETDEYSVQLKNKIHLKKGHILFMAGEDASATSQYSNILAWGDTSALAEANYWLCHINKMEQLNNDPYNPILLESLPECEWTATNNVMYKRTPEKTAPEQIKETQLTIYPNPTKDYFTARFMSDGDEQVTIELLDLNGKVMTEPYLLKSFRGYNQAKILTDGIRAGTYFVKLTSNQSVEFKRLILVD